MIKNAKSLMDKSKYLAEKIILQQMRFYKIICLREY